MSDLNEGSPYENNEELYSKLEPLLAKCISTFSKARHHVSNEIDGEPRLDTYCNTSAEIKSLHKKLLEIEYEVDLFQERV